MKRYDLSVSSGMGGEHACASADEDPEGEWVKYEDVSARVQALAAEMNLAADTLWRALGCPPGLIDPVKMAEDAAALIASLREQLDYARDIAIEHGEAREMAYDRDHPDD